MNLHFYWTYFETQKGPKYWYEQSVFVWRLLRQRNGGLNSGQKSANIVPYAFDIEMRVKGFSRSLSKWRLEMTTYTVIWQMTSLDWLYTLRDWKYGKKLGKCARNVLWSYITRIQKNKIKQFYFSPSIRQFNTFVTFFPQSHWSKFEKPWQKASMWLSSITPSNKGFLWNLEGRKYL